MKNKYGNRKILALFRNERVEFDSIKEFERAKELEMLEKAGQVSNLRRQVKVKLLDGFYIKKNGKSHKLQDIQYVADFVYTEKDKTVIEDVKSDITKKEKTYGIKKKMVLSIISDKHIFREWVNGQKTDYYMGE